MTHVVQVEEAPGLEEALDQNEHLVLLVGCDPGPHAVADDEIEEQRVVAGEGCKVRMYEVQVLQPELLCSLPGHGQMPGIEIHPHELGVRLGGCADPQDDADSAPQLAVR